MAPDAPTPDPSPAEVLADTLGEFAANEDWGYDASPLGDAEALIEALVRQGYEIVRLRSAGNGETVTMLDRAADALEAQAARITELEAEREALRRFALQQHIAIGALRRIHGGNRLFDDTGAERLWMFGESDKGWALIEEPTTPTEETP